MKGIILKDLYENFRIFKNGVSYLAAVLFLFLLIEAMQTGDLFSLKYFFMLITAFVFPLLGCSSIESSLDLPNSKDSYPVFFLSPDNILFSLCEKAPVRLFQYG